MQETWVWRRKWQPTPELFPGESHEHKSLAGYSPRGCNELDTTERLSTAQHMPSTAGEAPLQPEDKPLECGQLDPRAFDALWGGYLPSPPLPASQSCGPRFRTPDVGREKWASVAAPRMGWEATCHLPALTCPFPRVTHQLSLAPGESAGWDLSGPELCPLGAGRCKSREAAPRAPSAHPNSQLWAPKVGWNFSSGSPDFSKALWSVGDCFRQGFPGAGYWTKAGEGGAGCSSQFTGYFRLQPEPKLYPC